MLATVRNLPQFYAATCWLGTPDLRVVAKTAAQLRHYQPGALLTPAQSGRAAPPTAHPRAQHAQTDE